MPLHGTRWPLRDGWQMARVPPGASEGVSGPDDANPGAGGLADTVLPWVATPGLLTAGAWLASQGAPMADLDDETWCWRLRFDKPAGLGDDAILALDGLATCCTVTLNGEPLLDSDNMFVAHRVPVGQRLQDHDNELRVTAWPLAPRLAQRRPRPAWRVPMLRQQQLRWWRTTLLGRTPGWSPSVPVVGPWRPVWLGPSEAVLSERLLLRPMLNGDTGWLQIELPDAPETPMELALQRGAARYRAPLERDADGCAKALLRIDNVARWWPHTHGDPALYESSLTCGEGEAAREWPLSPVGFRTVQWQHNSQGTGLRVNGVPVFARGACWTPLDTLQPHASDAAYTQAVAQVQDAGMNMLRVAGPMVYEPHAFHEACDRAGVMVWQDFMLANMDYPVDDAAFIATLALEVRQQLARWQGSPSLVMLCGNSEVEQQAAMLGMPRERWSSALFEAHLPTWCAGWLPDTPYWPSSAHGGAWPFSPAGGTCSYYGVGAYQRPLVDARDSGVRFATECLAFSQVPEQEALSRLPGGGHALRVHHAAWKQGAPRDLGAGWDFEDVRDHYLGTCLGVDPTALRRHDHERYLMLSRLVVARVVEATFSQWRAAGSACQGALVWFLRDLQPGAGWGFLDDQGGPKSAWYALRRVLQPTTVLLTDEGLNGLALHLVNDRAEAVEARWSVGLYQGARCLEMASQACTLAPRHTQRVELAAVFPQFTDLAWAYRFGPPAADLVQAVLQTPDGRVLARAHHVSGGWPSGSDDTASLQVQAQRADDAGLVLELKAQRLALGVHIEVAGHRPEDNWFDMAPGECRRVRLRAHGQPPRVRRGHVHAANHRWPVTVVPPGDGDP
jgi:beta-mannosidase